SIAPGFWRSGRHLELDLTGVFGWPVEVCYRIAILVPLAVWALLLIFGAAEKPGGREVGRWLAGSIGFGSSRRWLLIWTFPFAAILASTLSDLGGGADAYPGAAWGTLAVLLVSLVGVALSGGVHLRVRQEGSGPELPPASPLRPWPEALASHGVEVRTLASWPNTGKARSIRQRAAGDLHERLRLRGARVIAPELIEAVDDLLGANGDGTGRSRLIFAPDDCGQTEVVALAAEILEQRFHAATLVVVASNSTALAAELAGWVPNRKVSAVGPAGEIERNALIVVADAQILSDRVLPQLKNPELVKRFGLIVWWHLEAFSGVLAANLWAISRRLHRLLDSMGRYDLRTLAFVRSTPHGDAQPGAFVRRLLPHPLPAESEVPVESRMPRDVHLHLLESHEQFFAREEGRSVLQRYRYLPLVAAKVSVEENWATHLDVPTDIPTSEAQAFLKLTAGDVVLSDRLRPDNATAAARIREIQSGELLSLVEMISHGGRSAPEGLPHHVGITRPSNPYAAYLLSRLTGDRDSAGFGTSRRLVSVDAQPGVMRRHLLLALDELPDTRTGLQKNFFWNDTVIRRTLEEIAGRGQLERSEVRYLDEWGELRREHEYRSKWVPTGDRRPLDTVGDRLVEVRDLSSGGDKGEGLCMLVDPERLTIQAYPHRVFLHDGQRYEIKEWGPLDAALAGGRIECARQSVHSDTWRIRNAHVFNIEPIGPPVRLTGKTTQVTRFTASLRYNEEVSGVYRITPKLGTSAVEVDKPRLGRPIQQGFDTRALVLRLSEEEKQLALLSLAQALSHLLPVHLGVEEDALEVVSLTGEIVQGRPAFGLAIVDLYPGGIGLVEAIGDDNAFLLQLLQWAKEWLQNCACNSPQGCPQCLRSPAALAANIDLPPVRSAAIELLDKVM
ncbi:MAG: DUF1998 domain-containing protein, partial [Acidobacteria bacterium]|nr:DUF1998 domain-containing protein [Acidobacteriota bacterium]